MTCSYARPRVHADAPGCSQHNFLYHTGHIETGKLRIVGYQAVVWSNLLGTPGQFSD